MRNPLYRGEIRCGQVYSWGFVWDATPTKIILRSDKNDRATYKQVSEDDLRRFVMLKDNPCGTVLRPWLMSWTGEAA